jgi:small subunit ribosomal protein S6
MVTEKTAVKKEKLNNYEMVVIFNPEVVEDRLEAAINNITGFVTNHSGAISEVIRWGKRSLAYPIKHSVTGTYVLARFTLRPTACKELENNLRISEQVLRHLLIKLDVMPAPKQVAPVAPPTPPPAAQPVA